MHCDAIANIEGHLNQDSAPNVPLEVPVAVTCIWLRRILDPNTPRGFCSVDPMTTSKIVFDVTCFKTNNLAHHNRMNTTRYVDLQWTLNIAVQANPSV
eukprot:3524765-Amphidinium_carterae.1